MVYRSRQKPGYACWVSFFPGNDGAWYLTCEEVTRPEKPYPRMSRAQYYAFALPSGYDKAPYKMEIVLLESRDGMKTWNVISREAVRYQHSAGSFGQARTRDGRFLRFVWETYSLEPNADPGQIFTVSTDGGKTWVKQPPFHDKRFCSYPHRLRTLRDGTLVLALPLYTYLTHEPLQLIPSWSDWIYIALLAGVCSVYAYSVAVELMKRVSVFLIQLTLNLEPVYGIVMAVLIFKQQEKMGVNFYIGTIIILSAVASYPLLKRKVEMLRSK